MSQTGVILLVPPEFVLVRPVIAEAMLIHGMTEYQEIEQRAGCRCFRLTKAPPTRSEIDPVTLGLMPF